MPIELEKTRRLSGKFFPVIWSIVVLHRLQCKMELKFQTTFDPLELYNHYVMILEILYSEKLDIVQAIVIYRRKFVALGDVWLVHNPFP